DIEDTVGKPCLMGDLCEAHGAHRCELAWLDDDCIACREGSRRVPTGREGWSIPRCDGDNDAIWNTLGIGVPVPWNRDGLTHDFICPAGVVAKHLRDLGDLAASVPDRLPSRH